MNLYAEEELNIYMNYNSVISFEEEGYEDNNYEDNQPVSNKSVDSNDRSYFLPAHRRVN